MAVHLRISPRFVTIFTAQYRFFLGAMALILLVVGYVFIIQPRWQEIRTTGVSDLREQEQRLSERKKYLGELRDLESRFSSIQARYGEELQKVRRVLPREEDLPSLIVQLDALAVTNNVSLDTITISRPAAAAQQGTAAAPGKETPESGATAKISSVHALQVSVDFSEGQTYVQFKQFLSSLEEHIRLFDVISLQYTPVADSGAEGEKYKLNFTTYYTS